MIRLIFFFMIGVMAAEGEGMAEDISACPVDTVPIQIIRGTEHLAVTTLSDADIIDFPPGFTAFVISVTEHIAAKLTQEKLNLDNTESKERSLLQFVSWPIISDSLPSTSVSALGVQPSGGCRISSPWIELTIEWRPNTLVRGIVRYNERQLLADQAILAGARNVPSGVALPLKRNEFNQYADFVYAPSKLCHRHLQKSKKEQVPPDLLWLFSRAWRDPDGCFSSTAGASMRKAMEVGAEGYTKIVIALIDRCFESDGEELHYGSILDIAGLIPLKQYKIVTPIIVKPIIN